MANIDTQAIQQKARETIGELAHKASDTASNLSARASELASNFSHDLSERAAQLQSQAGELSADLVKNSDQALNSAGLKLSEAGKALDGKAPEEGQLAAAVHATAAQISASGEYLSKNGVGNISKDLSGLVHKYPLQSLGLGIVVGLLVGKIARR